MNRVVFSSATDDWATPRDLYDSLNAEFLFADDPCPLNRNDSGAADGLLREWISPVFVNPPYSSIIDWMKKAFVEWQAGKTIVLLVPSRTDTRWWHSYAMKATEIRFIKGRLRFGGQKNAAPFPSALVIFKGAA